MNIKALRKALGYSQEDMAREIGTSFKTYHRWEHNYPISKMGKTILKNFLDSLDPEVIKRGEEIAEEEAEYKVKK